ncbi:putative ABC transporter ATP-binding protein [compost metagenome]
MNLFRRLFFTDINPVVQKAKTEHVTEKDMLPLPSFLDPRGRVLPEEKIEWTTPKPFLISLLKIQKGRLGLAYTWYGLSTLASLATPWLVNAFVSAISQGVTKETLPTVLVLAISLGFCGLLTGLLLQHYFYNTLISYQTFTNIINRRIFTHSLRLSPQARQKNQVGDIVNHMSSDCDAASDFALILADLIMSFLMMIGVIVTLFYFIGWSALAALIVLFTLAPLTRYVAKKFTKLDEEMMHHRDRRVTMMTQALNAIRVVKFFAWEKSVATEVMDVRNKELGSRRKLARSEVLSGLAYMAVSTIVLFVALMTHVWRGLPLDAALIFTCVSLFALLEGPFGELSHLLSRYTAAVVGADRILKFLKQEELPENPKQLTKSDGAVGVKVRNLSAYYEKSESPTLSHITFEVKRGGAVAIVGPVGSGKSSLLFSVLGEMKISQGEITYDGIEEAERPRLAYVPQEAYIVNSTLLENILFGEKATGEELRRALHASCLDKDMKEWKAGLRTEIGEKGVNLSGGQKQRVGLARAYLSNAQVVLLDDPLSAVDADTENLLCERLIFGAWKNKTRIMVTHRLEHLGSFDEVIFIEQGQVKAQGRFEEILKNSEEFKKFYSEHGKTQGEGSAQHKATETAVVAESTVDVASLADSETRITEDEDREKGAVKATIYWDYIKSLGGLNPKTKPWILGLLLFGALFVAIAPLAQKSWLSYYSSHQDSWPALAAIGIYGLLGVSVLILSLLNNLLWLDRGIKAGRNMHDQMLKSVLKAPVRFFDSTPIGRIIQRFSRDIESVDVYLQWSFVSVVACLLQVVVSLILIVSVMPLMIVVIIPIMAVYYVLQKNYRGPAREVKRYDSIARSPRYAHFKETLQGLTVIRAFSKDQWFMQNFYDRLSESQRMFFSHVMLNRWFSTRIPVVGGLISMATTVGIALSAYHGLISAGTAGLVTLYSLSFWAYLNWGVRMFADIESRMTSIERLKFFANIPPEKDVMREAVIPLRESWPEKGEVLVDDIKVRYAPHLPLVLKGVSCSIAPGSKVGIIGRTGSGKSTFFQTLFRFIELEEGKIIIDGVDIATVPLERLRRSMAIIPQDPTLFMGTVRNNLDRYNEYTDEEIRRSLEHASLWSYVSGLPLGIHAPVTEGGQNFSQGQRQLLCLARALLTEARIIVMDEATASVDVQTDAILQQVIRKELKGVTLLIIAHRLGTVQDCDQIVEIKAGESQTYGKSEISHVLKMNAVEGLVE